MKRPVPRHADVIRFEYLWGDEARKKQEFGVKKRPCVVLDCQLNEQGDTIVLVAPISHTAPSKLEHGYEIHPETKRRLGLDNDRSWVVLTDLNEIVWPHDGLHAVPHKNPPTCVYGLLPSGSYQTIVQRIKSLRDQDLVIQVKRPNEFDDKPEYRRGRVPTPV